MRSVSGLIKDMEEGEGPREPAEKRVGRSAAS